VNDELTEIEQAIAERRELESVDEENRVLALAALLKQEPARDLLWRVLDQCGVFGEIFDPNFGKTGYLAGRRSVGLWLLTQIAEASPDAYLAMQLKANRAKAAAAAENRAKSRRSKLQP